MPGVSIIADAAASPATLQEAETALRPALHDSRYALRVLHRDPIRLVAVTAYPHYPIERYRFGDTTVLAEGRFYGRRASALPRRLEQLSELTAGGGDTAEIAAWLADEDGDFIVYILDGRDGGVRVVTDSFARLPLYLHHVPGRFLLSRELGVVARLVSDLRFDRIAIAQHLLIGYPLGSRTLVGEVTRVPPASYLRLSGDLRTVETSLLSRLDLEKKDRGAFSVADNAHGLVELLTEACAARCESDRIHVVAMSGGFDSRAAAAGLHAVGQPFESVTFLDHVGSAASDVGPAERVAALFGSPWSLIRLGPPRPGDVATLLRLKSGMNPLGMSFLLPFLVEVGARCDWNLILTTGEWGTFTLPELAPPVALGESSDLVDFLVDQSRKLPIDLVARLTGLDSAEIRYDLHEHLMDYPERDFVRKLAHFVLAERALKWQSEGEDRNRAYFWTTSPFIAKRFFDFAMGCPDSQKRYFHLYRELLQRLSPGAAAIAHAGYGIPITSPKFATVAKGASLLARHPAVAERLTPRRDGYEESSVVIRLMRAQLDDCALIERYFDGDALRDILDRSRDHRRDQIDLLFTATSAIELLGTGQTSIDSADLTGKT